jgi:hypothetical protein
MKDKIFIINFCFRIKTSIRNKRSIDGGQGDTPLGLPPPLGECGGHIHPLFEKIFKKMDCERIFPA